MKLVIQTQIRENYGAHDWDGHGDCPQRWKCKGGNTYIVEDLSSKHVNKIVDGGIPTLKKLIEEDNDHFEEYILDFEIVGDDEIRWEAWEHPVVFSWGGDRWLANRTVKNDEYGYMRSEIAAAHESWIPQEGGERAHFELTYEMHSGEMVPYKDLSKVLEAA